MNNKGTRGFILGYSYIFHSMLMYFFNMQTTGAGLTQALRFFSEHTGVNLAAATSINTIGSILACLSIYWPFGTLLTRKGPRWLTTVSLITGGLFGMVCLGFVKSLFAYFFTSIAVQITLQGYCFNTTNTLITNWWPRKKGIVLGVTTTGLMWSSVIGIPLMIVSFNKFGFAPTVIGTGSLMIFTGIISWFWLRNTPEEVGLSPDNIPLTEEEEKAGLGQTKSASQWSTHELLKQKTSIFFIIGWGLFALCSAGAPMIMIPFFMEIGFSPPVAITIFSLGAFVGIGFSIALGAIDTKTGPRKSTMIFSVIFFIGFFSAFICAKFGLRWPAAICLHIAGGASGGFANLAASYIGSVYGRESFPHAFRVIWTGASLFRALVFLIIGSVIAFLGSYTAISLVFSFCCIIGGILLAFIPDSYLVPPKDASLRKD